MRLFKEFIIIVISALAIAYLFLPSLLPDIVPFVGWLDEGLATTILLSALKHYGLDLTGLFGNNKVETVPTKNEGVLTLESGQQTQKVRIPREVLERALQDYQQNVGT